MIACVVLPHFPLLVELQRKPALRGMPVVIADGPKRNDVVVDCSSEAVRLGVREGMTVDVVLTLCHEAALLVADPVRYHKHSVALLDALEQASPLVEPGELGCAFLDLKGLGALYGTIDALVRDLRQRVLAVSRQEPHIGIAAGKFPAHVAALQAQPGQYLLLDPEETASFLAPRSIDVLPVSQEMKERLWRLGLKTLGLLVPLSFSALQAQFGPEGGRTWHLIRGNDPSPVRPRPYRESASERMAFDAPMTSIETLGIAIQELVNRLYARASGGRVTVRQVRLRLLLEDDRTWEQEYTPNEPVSTPEGLTFFLLSKLKANGLPGPAGEMALEITVAGGESGRQGRLLQDGGQLEQQVKAAARQLAVRYGTSPLMKVVAVEPWSRIPERRWALITYEP